MVSTSLRRARLIVYSPLAKRRSADQQGRDGHIGVSREPEAGLASELLTRLDQRYHNCFGRSVAGLRVPRQSFVRQPIVTN